MTNDTTYRQAIEELETILRALETDTVDVDDLTARVQRSAELIRLCKQKLRNAESAIERVFENLEEEDEHEPSDETDSPPPLGSEATRYSQNANGLPGQLPF
jgi:exodeoxyribonuclease VII small subunit